MNYSDIRFPNLGIVFSHVGHSISLGSFEIMYYGIVIACGFLAGLFVARRKPGVPDRIRSFIWTFFSGWLFLPL